MGRELKKIESMGIDKEKIDAEFKEHKKKLDDIDSEMKSLKKTEAETLKGIADAQAAVDLNKKKAAREGQAC